jgi:hypothetical protein
MILPSILFPQILKVQRTLRDGSKGPCWGYLKDGDVITHVNDENVDGMDKKKVVELFNSSWKAVLDVIRVEGNLWPIPRQLQFANQLIFEFFSRWFFVQKTNYDKSSLGTTRYPCFYPLNRNIIRKSI